MFYGARWLSWLPLLTGTFVVKTRFQWRKSWILLNSIQGNQVMTISLKVVKYFSKPHSDLLRTISRLVCSGEFTEHNLCFLVKSIY